MDSDEFCNIDANKTLEFIESETEFKNNLSYNKKTGKIIILHEATQTGGIGGELSAYISEHLFEYLDGPVMRATSLDTPIPFAKTLEKQFLPIDRFKEKIEKLLKY